MDVAEAMIKYVLRYVMNKCPDELSFFNSFVDKGLLERLEHVASSGLRPGELYGGCGDSLQEQRSIRLSGVLGL